LSPFDGKVSGCCCCFSVCLFGYFAAVGGQAPADFILAVSAIWGPLQLLPMPHLPLQLIVCR